MIYAVTGSSTAGVEAEPIVHEAISQNLGPGDVLVSGCAFGVDTYAVEAVAETGRAVILTVPVGKPYNVPLTYRAYFRPEWSTQLVPGGYMKRNDRTVELADVLLAFPRTAEEELRSGTWATVRRARKKGIPVLIYPLDSTA